MERNYVITETPTGTRWFCIAETCGHAEPVSAGTFDRNNRFEPFLDADGYRHPPMTKADKRTVNRWRPGSSSTG